MTTIDLDRSEWHRRLQARWKWGAENLGDSSFSRPFAEICREVIQEIEDTAGWLFIAWVQARRARGDAIDLAQREALQQEFLQAAERSDLGHFSVHDEPVARIARIAGAQFIRWQIMRSSLTHVLHSIEALPKREPEATYPHESTRGRRGSRNDPRSSD